jgi:molybdopterin molybdotransferase
MISTLEATQIFRNKLFVQSEVLSLPIFADRDYPPMDRVMMDGIALNFETFDLGLRRFVIEGIQAAGGPQKTLQNSQHCLEVMTGAILPLGTDLVIPYEHLEINQGVATIVNEVPRNRLENVHLKGSDCRESELVLKSGVRLNGPRAGIAASMGMVPQLCHSSKILIISTGDELVELTQKPLNYQIRRSNIYALKTSLEDNGFKNISLAHLNDNAQIVADHYHENANNFQVMLYSGGVSKGKFDYLPQVWKDMGVTKYFHEVAQRPGKPLWFGRDEKRKTVVIGLPGNPVSSLVCLHRYVIPTTPVYARLSEEVIFKKNLTYFIPAKIEFQKDGSLWALPLKIKNSGEFTGLSESDGFVELPAEKCVFHPGEAYSFWPWRNFL